MNTVKKVLSRKSHSDDSSDDGRHSTSTAPTSNPGSPVSRQKEFGTMGATGAGAGAATAGNPDGRLHNYSSTNGTTATTGTTGKSTVEKVEDKLGLGRSGDVHATDGSLRHKSGHDIATNKHLDLNSGKVDQDVQHLAAVTHRTHQRHEVEEVTRQREHERHVHHVQHHVQPVLDSEHAAEQAHQKVHPVTRVHEKHASTDKDAALLTSVAGKHADQYAEAPLHRQVVDKGELVNEHIHHHIHNVVQPIIQKDTHEYHRIHTTIPTHVITHEAPIVHESTHHKPVSKADFLSGGGSLTNKFRSVHEANLLNTGKCDRTVDGLGEQLEKELGLKSSHGLTGASTTTGAKTNGTTAI